LQQLKSQAVNRFYAHTKTIVYKGHLYFDGTVKATWILSRHHDNFRRHSINQRKHFSMGIVFLWDELRK